METKLVTAEDWATANWKDMVAAFRNDTQTVAEEANNSEARAVLVSNQAPNLIQTNTEEPVAPAIEGRFSRARRWASEKYDQVRGGLENNKRKMFAFAGAVLLSAGGLIPLEAAATQAGASNAKVTHITTKDNAKSEQNDCNNASLTSVNPTGYTSGAFLPSGKSNTAEQAASRVQSWLSSKGPLAGPKTNQASLALEYAAIAQPAQSKTIEDKINYKNAFNNYYNQLKGPNARYYAHRFCGAVASVMGQTESYTNDFTGVNLLELRAQYKDGNIVGVEEVPSTNTNLGPGVEFSVDQGSGLTQITPVFVAANGLEYVTGVLPSGGKKTNKNGQSGNKLSKQPLPLGSTNSTNIEASAGSSSSNQSSNVGNGTESSTGSQSSEGTQGSTGQGLSPETPAPGVVGTSPGTGSTTSEGYGSSTPSTPPSTTETSPPPAPPSPPTPTPTNPTPEKAGDSVDTNPSDTLPGTTGTGNPFNAGGSSDASQLAN